MEHLYQVTVPYACFGLITDAAGIIVFAPPIARWTQNESITAIKAYYEVQKQGQVIQIY